MEARRSASPDSMPSVVVLIPPVGGDQAASHPALASSPKYPSPSPRREPGASTSTSASLRPLPPSSPSSAGWPPLASSSSSLRSSSSLLLQPSGSSLSSSAASSSSSSSSINNKNTTHKGRFGHYDQLSVDPADPFDAVSDPYMSAKRCAPAGQDLYTCRWRLRDKKLLDARGHMYCNCKLMTPDLLAKHALSHHIDLDPLSAPRTPDRKVACKWGNCFNRHYNEPAALASHLVHDHLTHQMGLKYACIANKCPAKPHLTSYMALVQHHARYHAGTLHAARLRPIWQPVRAPTNEKHTSRLLAALADFDAQGGFSTTPNITVSKRANPLVAPISSRERAMVEIEYKRNYFDPIDVRPGEGQDGQPWIRLHKRLEHTTHHHESVQAACDAIFRAVSYDDQDFLRAQRAGLESVEVTGDLTLQAIEQGLRKAQPYEANDLSSPHRAPCGFSNNLSLPLEESCKVWIAETPEKDLVETICPLSLVSVEREMNFDAALSKQRRWVDKIFQRNCTPRYAQESSSSVENGLYESIQDWAPPLRLDPYHPASRCRYPVLDDERRSTSPQKPRAVRRLLQASQHDVLPSDGTLSMQSRASTPSGRSERSGSDATRLSLNGPVNAILGPVRVKREREDGSPPLAIDLELVDVEPPTSKLKGDDSSNPLELHVLELQ